VAEKKLVIWVEGNNDEAFFRRCLTQEIEAAYEPPVRFEQYAQKTPNLVNALFDSLKKSGYYQLVFGDIDLCQCPTQMKEALRKGKFKTADATQIFVVIKEIESWYLAGLDDVGCKTLGLAPVGDTDNLSKEQFDALQPARFDSRVDFLIEITKLFSVERAENKNKSFRYFAGKFLPRRPEQPA
jgi:hypothetical protein